MVEPTICNFLTIIYEDLKFALMHLQMLHVKSTLSNLLEVHSHVSIGTLLVCEVRPTHLLPWLIMTQKGGNFTHLCHFQVSA